VPLYLSLLPPAMKRLGLEENPIEQMRRLFFDHLAAGKSPTLDDKRRIRLDDRELRPEVQAVVSEAWPNVTTENLFTLTDFEGFRREFRNLFGFDVDGVDYNLPVETELTW
jgi:enoyl-[acyl-carrier protein] reductase/trans-2-enoyl-CoA reductase (NAD+)